MGMSLRKILVILVIFFVASLLSGCGLLEIFGRGLGAICDTEIFILTKQEDTNDGVCTPDDCSLREAVITANECAGVQAIRIPDGFYRLTLAGEADEDAAASGDLDILDPVILEGVGEPVIDGNGTDRIFEIALTDNADEVYISGLTIQQGRQSVGGGILVRAGTLFLNEMVLQGNTAGGPDMAGSGGALLVYDGAVQVRRTTFSANAAYGEGGAVLVGTAATIDILDSTLFENNRSLDGYGGGGLVNRSLGPSTITDSRFMNNTSSGAGGGIYNVGSLNVADTYFEGNQAETTGGGISTRNNGFAMAGSELRRNQAVLGGGLYITSDLDHSFTSPIAVVDVLMTNNSATRMGGGIFNSTSVDLTISDSYILDGEADEGGGIFNLGRLSVEQTEVSGNHAESNGGGIFNRSEGILQVVLGEVFRNDASLGGGGIYNRGETSIRMTTIGGNTAGGVEGGGIYNAGSLTLEHSTLSVNRAFGETTVVIGASAIWNMEGSLTIENSTVSGNMIVSGLGGALFNFRGTIDVQSSTIVDNNTEAFQGTVESFPSITIRNSIVLNNGDGRDCGRPLTSQGWNLFEDTDCGFHDSDQFLDLLGVPAGLGPLADNGGPTMTHALLPGSPAIDLGDRECPASDQRGVSRPMGSACDAGAYEVETDLVSGTPEPSSGEFPTGVPVGPVTCRSGPSVVYPPTAYFDVGQQLQLLNRNDDATWLEVQGGGRPPCWISEDLLEIDPGFNLMDLPPGTIPPTPTWTPVPPTETPGPQGCWHQGPNDNQPLCYVPCPPNPNPGGACTP